MTSNVAQSVRRSIGIGKGGGAGDYVLTSDVDKVAVDQRGVGDGRGGHEGEETGAQEQEG